MFPIERDGQGTANVRHEDALGPARAPVEGSKEANPLRPQTRLLQNLALGGGTSRFSGLDMPTDEAPLPLGRAEGSLQEEYGALIVVS